VYICVHLSTGFIQKENIVYTGFLQIFHTTEKPIIENFAFDA
jgi:hypothetical protein